MNERFALAQPMSLPSLAAEARSTARGLPELLVEGVARFGLGGRGDLCFCDRDPGAHWRAAAGAIVLTTSALVQPLSSEMPEANWVPLDDPRSAFIMLVERMVDSNAVSISDAIPRPFGIHSSARLGAHSFVHEHVNIDEGVVIGAGCVIHRGTWIQAGATIRDNSVIGSEGIDAHLGVDGVVRRFPHLASVIIGRDAIVGASVVIPRGILTSTRIGRRSVIGNLSNVGHCVVVEDDVWMSSGCLIGGHTRIGAGASIGIGSTLNDNIVIGERAQIGMGSVVIRSVNPGASVIGNPARSLMGSARSGPAR
jgi:UDP-3-O-[3-hydroxymyristoyl] glucosamine N-acyltransferase